MIRLWLDDIRPAPPDDEHGAWWICRTAEEARDFMVATVVDEASFDHDLGECYDCEHAFPARGYPLVTSTCRHRMTGYDLVKWLAEHGHWPRQKPRVHSANPAGKAKMVATIERYWTPPAVVGEVYVEHGIPTARMDYPGVPVCACGRSSTHESGWCGIPCAYADGCTGCSTNGIAESTVLL